MQHFVGNSAVSVGRAEHVGHTARAGHVGRTEHVGHTARAGHVGRAEHVGHIARAGRAEHVDHTARAGHISRAEHVGHIARSSVGISEIKPSHFLGGGDNFLFMKIDLFMMVDVLGP